MEKKFLKIGFSVLVASLVLVSCEKDDGEKIYLPERIIWMEGSVEHRISFEYDAQNRLTKATRDNYSKEYSYPKDKFYVVEGTRRNPPENFRTEAVREGDMVTEAETDLSDGEEWITKLTLSNEQLVHLNWRDGIEVEDYMYDAVGNLAKVERSNEEHGTYIHSYDNKKGIFSNVKTPAWLLWDIDNLEGFCATVNNILKIEIDSSRGESVVDIAYTYNDAGYPVSFQFTARESVSATIEYKTINQ